MALVVRLDVDRPFGKRDLAHRLASRVASEAGLCLRRLPQYLEDLNNILILLGRRKWRSYVFFRKCTMPSQRSLRLIDEGGHVIGLHLEDSRFFDRYVEELEYLEMRVGRKVEVFSKHGSGKHKYGLHHYPQYEPEKYLNWGQRSGMKAFFGNMQDPTLIPSKHGDSLLFFPAAFWLEHSWRDTQRFSIQWLVNESRSRDIALLMHPDNIMGDPVLTREFNRILESCEATVVS